MLVLCLAMPVLRADSIDEADAKRRGVPVAQVQAENALAREKVKTAALEKQLADLQKKLAELQGGGGTAAGTAPAGATSAPAAPAGGTAAGDGLNFDGPRAASPMADAFIKRYMEGDWEKLAADLDAKKAEIAALPAGNAADLAYIARAIAESRPIWWNDIKSGKAKEFRQLVWRQTIQATYQSDSVTQVSSAAANGVFTAKWPREQMDSRDSYSVSENGLLRSPGDLGFKTGGACTAMIWQMMGNAAGAISSGWDQKAVARGTQGLHPPQLVLAERHGRILRDAPGTPHDLRYEPGLSGTEHER
jgi:hypothetical protein